jgi:hypothetical protein
MAKNGDKAGRKKNKEGISNANILRECHNLYTDSKYGLIKIGKSLGLPFLVPRRKIMIMLIGNHSAGKSSFINWYVGDKIQKTGVAIETQGFTFITNGKKRESLTGKATIHLHPHFKTLESIRGITDFISTEISPSTENRFNFVTFIDTPGLVDGEMYYPYDVDKAILWLGNIADLIFVFFDPIGQALCKRTLDLVQKLNSQASDKIKFFLSKADEAGDEHDRQKVMMQIVQELCKRPGLNRCGFAMSTIYIPDPAINRPTKCLNQIDEIHEQIEKTINFTIQNGLNTLDKDYNQVISLIEKKIEKDNETKNHNIKIILRSSAMIFLAILIPFVLFSHKMTKLAIFDTIKHTPMAHYLKAYLSTLNSFWETIPPAYHLYGQIIILTISIILFILSIYLNKIAPVMDKQDRVSWIDKRNYLVKQIKSKKHSLYREYLSQSINEDDFDM